MSGAAFSSWSNGNYTTGDPTTANPVCLLSSGNSTQNIILTYTTSVSTTTTLSSSANPSTFGTAATLTATLTPSAATGSVTFTDTDAASAVCSNVSVSSGTATCALPANLGAGPHHYTASFAGTGVYTNSVSSTFTQTVNKANQTISFGALASKTFGDADFTVSATASSGLAVSFSASGDCTVTGSTVHITGAGSCTITASQPGNANFNAAASVQRTFSIAKAAATLSLSGLGATYDGSSMRSP